MKHVPPSENSRFKMPVQFIGRPNSFLDIMDFYEELAVQWERFANQPHGNRIREQYFDLVGILPEERFCVRENVAEMIRAKDRLVPSIG